MTKPRKKSEREAGGTAPILLYQRKLLELEQEYVEIRDEIKTLKDELANADKETVQKLKLELDTLVTRARLLKDQTAYYMALKDTYDYARLFVVLQEELAAADPELAKRIIERIDQRWRDEWGVTYACLSQPPDGQEGEDEDSAQEKTDRSPS